MKSVTTLLAALVLTTVLQGVGSASLLLPTNTQYNVPVGTLVLEQYYGSNHAGKGTWVDPSGIITTNSDSITININSAAGVTYLPLPFANPRNVQKVIDIGIVGWSTNNWPNVRSATWRIQDGVASNGHYVDFAVTPDPALGSQNVDGGIVWGWNGNGVKAKLAENEVSVLRLSGASLMSAYVNEDSTVVTSQGAWGGGAGTNMLRLYSVTTGSSSWEIAWIKIYTGVDSASYGPALTAIPEPATLILLGAGMLLLKKRK